MNTTDRIAKWLRAAHFRKGAREVRLCRQIGRDTSRGHEDLQSFHWTDATDFNEKELAAEAWEVSAQEAAALGGRTHAFQLRAIIDDENVSEMTYRIVNLHSDATVSEGTDDSGLTRQLMRHNEVLVRTLVGSMGAQLQAYQGTMEHLTERLAESETARAQLAKESLESQEGRLMLAAGTAEIEAASKRDAEMMGQLMRWGDVFVTQLMRKQGVLTEGMPAPVRDLIRDLDQDQIEKIIEVLSPEQSAKLGEMWLAIQAEEKAKQAH